MKRGTIAIRWAALLWMAPILVLVGCSEPPPAGAVPSLTVTVVSVQEASVPRRIEASGQIAPWEDVAVGVELASVRVVGVHAEVGDTVRAGDLLVSLDTRTLEDELTRAQAALSVARAREVAATRRATRAAELAQAQLVSVQDAETLAAEREATVAEREAAEAAVRAARTRLGFATLRAPVSGLVAQRSVQPGQVVGPTDTLFKLIRDGRLEWRAELSTHELKQVAPGGAAKVRVAGAEVDGRIRQVSPAINAAVRTGLVYVDLPEHPALRAGDFVQGELVLGQDAGRLVPASALVSRDGFHYIYTVDEQSIAREVRVQLGDRLGNQVELLDGPDLQARIVARGASFLNDGDLVRVLDEAAKPEPAQAPQDARP